MNLTPLKALCKSHAISLHGDIRIANHLLTSNIHAHNQGAARKKLPYFGAANRYSVKLSSNIPYNTEGNRVMVCQWHIFRCGLPTSVSLQQYWSENQVLPSLLFIFLISFSAALYAVLWYISAMFKLECLTIPLLFHSVMFKDYKSMTSYF